MNRSAVSFYFLVKDSGKKLFINNYNANFINVQSQKISVSAILEEILKINRVVGGGYGFLPWFAGCLMRRGGWAGVEKNSLTTSGGGGGGASKKCKGKNWKSS